MADYIWLIPFFPAFGFIINSACGNRTSKSFVSWIACLAIFLSFLTSLAIFYEFLQIPPAARIFETDLYAWINSGEFNVNIGFRIDALSCIFHFYFDKGRAIF